jgi:succinate dehydrogenase cytochrome b subunit
LKESKTVSRLVTLYRSTVGKKAIVASTGVILVLFLLAHAAGNLKVFLPSPVPGVPDIDVYGHFLRTVGEPLVPHHSVLWAARIVLLLALVLHVVCVIQLVLLSRGARTSGYERRRYIAATWSARLMMVSGLLLFAFIVFHILHFTTGTAFPSSFQEGKVYANLYRAFTNGGLALLYIAAMALLALHLYHGVWSMFQSLGLDRPDRNRLLRAIATLVAVLLFLGFSSVPLSFLSGAMKKPSELVSAGASVAAGATGSAEHAGGQP